MSNRHEEFWHRRRAFLDKATKMVVDLQEAIARLS